MLLLVLGCSSAEKSYSDQAGFSLDDTGGLNVAPSAEEDGGEELGTYYWQPLIDLKMDSNGDVIFDGSKIELWFYLNGSLECVQELRNIALVRLNTPIEEAYSWWEVSFDEGLPEEEGTSSCLPIQQSSFSIGIGTLHAESLASWGGINWQGLEPLMLSELDSSAYLSFQDRSEVWVYGIAIEEEGWLYLRPSYLFPL